MEPAEEIVTRKVLFEKHNKIILKKEALSKMSEFLKKAQDILDAPNFDSQDATKCVADYRLSLQDFTNKDKQ
jgi:hypothetical protein